MMTELSNVKPESRSETVLATPDKMVKIRELFGIDSEMEVPAFSEADERVPEVDHPRELSVGIAEDVAGMQVAVAERTRVHLGVAQ